MDAYAFGQKLAADPRAEAQWAQLPTTQVAAPPREDGSEVTYQDLQASQPKPAIPPSVRAWGGGIPSESDRAIGTLIPTKRDLQQFGRDFVSYGYNNPVWKAFRGAGRFVNAATGAKADESALGKGFDAMMQGDAPAPAAAPPPSAPATSLWGALQQAYEDNPYLVGGAGAGLGALGLYGVYNLLRKRRQRQQNQFSRARYPQIIN